MPGTPSGENHSSESHTCGWKSMPRFSSSAYKRLTRRASGERSSESFKSQKRSASSFSSESRAHGTFARARFVRAPVARGEWARPEVRCALGIDRTPDFVAAEDAGAARAVLVLAERAYRTGPDVGEGAP